MIKNRRLLALFILTEVLFLTLLYTSREYKTREFLGLQTSEATSEYQSVYGEFGKISQIVAGSMAETPEITGLLKEANSADGEEKERVRSRLIALMQKKFNNLGNLHFQEFRFLLADSRTFLRMTQAGFFDDGASAETQEERSPIHYLYPLFDAEKNLIGRAVFSLSPKRFEEELSQRLDAPLYFMTAEEIPSLLERDGEDKRGEDGALSRTEEKGSLRDLGRPSEYFFSKNTVSEIALKTGSAESFSLYINDNESVGTVTFLAVMRENTQQPAAYFVFYEDDPRLALLRANYGIAQAGGTLFILLVFIFLLTQEKRKHALERSVEEKTAELQELNWELSTLVQLRTEALQKESTFIREVLDALPVYIFWKDRDLNYLGCNALFAALAEVNSEPEIAGKSDFDLPWQEQAELFHSVDREVISTGVAQKNYISTLHLGKREMALSVSKVPLRDVSGNIIGVLGAFSDITELRQLEQAHEKLATVLDLNLNEVYIFSPDTIRVTYANHAALSSLGYTFDEMMAMSLPDLVAGSVEKVTALLRPLREGTLEHQVVQQEHRRKDGSTYPVETHFQCLEIQGQAQIVAISVDISERIQAEKEIKKLNERYELTLAGAGDGIWDWDLLSDQIYFSKRWKELLGFEEGEIENTFHEWESRVHPDDLQKAIEIFEANIAGKTERYENLHRLRHKDGRWIWILVRGKTIFDADGNAVRMLGTHTDVTEKKALEDKIAKNEASLVEAQKIAHLGNWEWDLAGHKITWSDELYRLLGEEPQSFEPTYRSLVAYLHPSQKARYRRLLRDILNTGSAEYEHVWKIIRKDGSAGYISSVIKIVRNSGGEAAVVQGTFLDVSERIEVEAKLAQMNSMLNDSYQKQKIKTREIAEAKNKLEKSHSEMVAAKAEAERASNSKSEFLANMSHEIRTPLNAMNGFISLLKSSETDDQKLNYLDIISHSSDTLLQIINDILDTSKIESGKMEIEEVDFVPRKELYNTVKLFQAKAAEKEISLHLDYSHTIPKVLHGDILRIKQILSNLLSNAIKFTPDRGLIECTVGYALGQLECSVKDNGIGIAEEKQQHVFESFSQADSSIVREYGGTGLGLTISAKLAAMLGGRLDVESKEGEGSTFSFHIPLSQSREADEKIEPHDPKREANLSGHLLLVEDNEANRLFVGIILKTAGLTYETANNGLEAIEKFKAGKFDLILMDENMPKLNGIGATKEILRIEEERQLKHTPIIALTANALVGDRKLFIDAGMDDYLAKPLEPKHLVQKISQLIPE